MNPKPKRNEFRGELVGWSEGEADGRLALRLLIKAGPDNHWAIHLRTNYRMEPGDLIHVKRVSGRDWVALWTPRYQNHAGNSFELIGEPQPALVDPHWPDDAPEDWPDCEGWPDAPI